MVNLKSFIAISIAAIVAYFEPVHHLLIAILFLIALNFVAGFIADLTANKNSFSFKKAFTSIREALVFLLLLASIYFIGDHLQAKNEIMQVISTITYALAYFYSVNILKNIRQIFPQSKIINIIYDLLSVEILSRLPKNNLISKLAI